MSYRILYTCGGRTLTIAPYAVCRLVEDGLHGFDCTGFDVKIQPYAASHGGYAQTARFAEREISVTFEIAASGEEAAAVRRGIVSMLTPDAAGTLDAELYGVRRVIDVIPSGEQEFVRGTFHDFTEVTLHFTAPAVFFRAHEETAVRFRDAAPILTFPMNFMSGAGTVSGMYRTTDRTSVDNPGDTGCGIVARIRASGGPVIRPGLTCGERFIRCPLTLTDGDELVIDTRQRRKNITLNGARCFTFDRDSTFFTLPSGESTVSVTCDSGGEYIDAEIVFVPLYYGV